MKDDDENTLIHWFCLITPAPGSAHIFSPEWKTSLSLSEGIRCFSTMIKNTLCEYWTLIWRHLGNVTAGMSSSLKSLNFIAQIQCLQGN